MSEVFSSEDALKKANSLFVDEKFDEALENYNLSIELDDANVDALLKRAQCHTKLENYTDAIEDANKVITLQPNNSKAYFRKGVACFELEEYATALAAFEKGASLDAADSSFKPWIRKCKAELDDESGTSTTPNAATVSASSSPSSHSVPSSSTPSPSPSPSTSSPSASSSSSLPPSSSKPSPVVTAPTPTPAPAPTASKIRHEWYQNATHVVVTVFAKGVKAEDLTVNIQTQTLSVTIKLSADNSYSLELDLAGPVAPAESNFALMSTKIEIKLKKEAPLKWNTLEKVEGVSVRPWDSNVSTSAPPATKTQKNWDKIASDFPEEKPEGEEGLNKVFQDIFSNGSDEQKRAMIKSFTESGGTVLSTNWGEVGKGEVKGSPPPGLEMKKWGKE